MGRRLRSRLHCLVSKYPSCGYFPSRLCNHPSRACYPLRLAENGQEGVGSWARTRDQSAGNFHRFPALAHTRAPRAATGLSPALPHEASTGRGTGGGGVAIREPGSLSHRQGELSKLGGGGSQGQLGTGVIMGAQNHLGCFRVADHKVSALGKSGFLHLHLGDMFTQKVGKGLLLLLCLSNLKFIKNLKVKGKNNITF